MNSSESVAQSVEHRPFKAVVPGSSPGRLTIYFSSLMNHTGYPLLQAYFLRSANPSFAGLISGVKFHE